MITFTYEENNTVVEVRSDAEQIERLLEDFKTFLRHVSYGENTISAVVYDRGEKEQGFPRQMDLFDERVGG